MARFSEVIKGIQKMKIIQWGIKTKNPPEGGFWLSKTKNPARFLVALKRHVVCGSFVMR